MATELGLAPKATRTELTHDVLLTWRVRLTAWSVLVVAGLIETVVNRHAMQDDGVNYLDMGDAILRHNWKMALDGIWSPLYPFLQALGLRIVKPSAYSQFTVVHCVNFLIYLFTLACFEFLLATVSSSEAAEKSARGTRCLPPWAVFGIGYSVFLWSSFDLITLRLVTPDMLMAGFMYLALALLLRVRAHPSKFSTFILLGAVLGIGYLAKAPVFPLSIVVFGIAWLSSGGWHRPVPRVAAAVLMFLALSAPWFLALSHSKGRFTFSDSGRFNYIVHVDGVSPDWFFQDLGNAEGQYLHPVKKIFDAPPVYEFPRTITATSALAYDPSYWAQGATPRVSPKRELSVVLHWLEFYLKNMFSTQTPLLVGFIVLAFMAGALSSAGRLTSAWPVWFMGLVGLGMYSLIYVELRYVAVFFTLLWVGLFASLEIFPGQEMRRLAAAVTCAIVIAMSVPIVISVVAELHHGVRHEPHTQWQVARDLQQLGIVKGDRVARLPGHYGLSWARLLGVTEVARIPARDAAEFWCEKLDAQRQAVQALQPLNVAAIVVEQPPSAKVCAPGPEWHRIGDGTFFALILPRQARP